jgi:hypothetical protein
MTPDERERMQILCERIAIEKDQKKFGDLVQELNDLLDRKSHRLDHPGRNPNGTGSV